jgi:DNA-binding MarR family transcriptional regulator
LVNIKKERSDTVAKRLSAKTPAARHKRTTSQGSRPGAPLTVSRDELLTNGTDQDFRKLVHGLLTFLGVHTAIRDGYASVLGLPGPRYTILLCIRNLSDSGPVNIRTVAEYLRLSGSFITAETNALEQQGYVSKVRGEDDRRTVLLAITPEGAALLDSIATLRRKINDVEFGCLNAKEFKNLVPLIARLVQSGERAIALLSYLRDHGEESDELRLVSSK